MECPYLSDNKLISLVPNEVGPHAPPPGSGALVNVANTVAGWTVNTHVLQKEVEDKFTLQNVNQYIVA
jgi:predicted ATP-grasp superfamily ATP-dependent carboligase